MGLEALRIPVTDLGLVTYDKLATVKMNMPVIDAINMFVDRHVTALPVVDDEGKHCHTSIYYLVTVFNNTLYPLGRVLNVYEKADLLASKLVPNYRIA
jgi:CBS domain-containing protein